MKYLLVLFALLNAGQASSQAIALIGKVKDSESNKGFWGATIVFKQADAEVTGAITDSTGRFRVLNILPGVYDVDINAIGYRTKSLSAVVVKADSAPLALEFPGPCQFIYSDKKLPSCIGGHTDHFLPIVYGLPGKKAMARAKAGKIYLGGCQVTGCDPKYYCPIHNKEL